MVDESKTEAVRTIPFSKATPAPGGGILGTGGGGGGSGAINVEGNIIKDKSGKPITFTSGGKTFFKTSTGTKIDSKTGQRIVQAPIQRVDPGEARPRGTTIVGAREGLFAEITDKGVQPTIFMRDPTGALKPTQQELTKESQSMIQRAKIPTRAGFSAPITRDLILTQRTTPRAAIRAAPKELIRSTKIERARGFLGSISRGSAFDFLTRSPITEPFIGTQQEARREKLGQEIGFALSVSPLGLLGKIGKPAKAAVSGVKAAAKAAKASKAIKLAQAAAATRAGKFFKFLGLQTAKGVLIPKVSKKISEITAPEEQKELIQQDFFKDVFSNAFGAETEAVSQKGIIKRIGFQLTPFAGEKKAFEKQLRVEAKARELTQKQTEALVKAGLRQRKATAIGEGITLLELSRGAEAFGRPAVKAAFKTAVKTTKKKAFVDIFKKTAIPIGLAGIGEASSQELAQQFGRGEKIQILPTKKDGFKLGIVGSGAAGFVSAALLGPTIAGLKPFKPGASKVVEIAASIGDPFEKPADILQDITEVAIKKVTGKAPARIGFTTVITPTESLTVGRRKEKPKAPPRAEAPKPIPSPKKTPSAILIQSITEAPIQTNIPSPPIPKTPTQIFSTTKTQTPVNIEDIVTQTPIQTPVEIPIPIISETPTQTPAETTTPTFTETFNLTQNIPIFTPTLKIPPPVPLTIPFGSGGAATRKGKAPKFIDELAAGTALLSKIIIGKAPPRPTKELKKKKKEIEEEIKKRRKSSRKTTPLFDFNKLLLG